MSVEVRLPTLLRQYTDGTASVTAEGATIGDVFAAIVGQYPGLGGQLIDESGALHKFVNVYVDAHSRALLGKAFTAHAIAATKDGHLANLSLLWRYLIFRYAVNR